MAKNLNASDYSSFLTSNFGPLAPRVAEAYPLSLFTSYPNPAYAAIEAVYTDYSYKCPAYRGLLQAVKNGVPTWTYEFNHTLSCTWVSTIPQQIVPILGPTHTEEIPLIFGNTDNLPLPNGTCNLNDQEKTLSKELIAAWTSMASAGNPGPKWPAYEPSASRGIVINNVTTIKKIDYSACKFWEKIYAAELKNATASRTGYGNTTSNGSTANPSSPSGRGPSPSPSAFIGSASSVGHSPAVWVSMVVLLAGILLV